MDGSDKPPLTPNRRRLLAGCALVLFATTTGLVATGWLPVGTYLVSLMLIGVGLGFIYERPWALRFGDWATSRLERGRGHERPWWHVVLLVAALIPVVALVLSAGD